MSFLSTVSFLCGTCEFFCHLFGFSEGALELASNRNKRASFTSSAAPAVVAPSKQGPSRRELGSSRFTDSVKRRQHVWEEKEGVGGGVGRPSTLNFALSVGLRARCLIAAPCRPYVLAGRSEQASNFPPFVEDSRRAGASIFTHSGATYTGRASRGDEGCTDRSR